MKVDYSGPGAAKIISQQRNVFHVQKIQKKFNIALPWSKTDIGYFEHIATTKSFCLQAISSGTQLHHVIYQNFHGMNAVAGTRIEMMHIGIMNEQNMIHSRNAGFFVEQAGRNTRTQQRIQYRRPATGMQLTNVYMNSGYSQI
jgi:hypothetical protein